ncbi:MAG: IS1182 family transposase [bacterium]
MARYKPYNYTQLRMIPVSLEQQLVSGTLEHTIHMVVEHEIDISIFDPQYNNDETGCRAYNPKSLLKVILMGFARGMLGSRKIERACHENIIFMALACGQVPDHSTIAAFVTTMKKEILLVFQRVLLICDRMNLIGGTTFAIDGVKLPGNASKQMSGTFAELAEKKKKFEARIAKMLEKHIACDQESGFSDTEKRKLKKLNQSIQKIDRFLQENEPKPGKKKKENKSNITDNDSQLMMSSHGVIQGYNAQALVDSKHQIIIHADAGNSGQDDEHLSIMVEGAKENLKAIGKNEKILEEAILLGDPNYNSPTNLKTCVEEHLHAIFPNTQFRKTDSTKDPEQSTFTITDFTFNEQKDTYTCPANNTLVRKSDVKKKGENYYRTYVAKASDCQGCPFKKRCLTKKTSKRRTLSVYYDKKVAEYAHMMEMKFNTEEGRALYDQRIWINEPVFANIRALKRMDRFLLRGKPKVTIQWLLYSLVHNIEK